MSTYLQLSEIWIYPIKSLGGIRLNESDVEARGLKYDRRWMIVDENNVFITQRKIHRMALLEVELSINGLTIFHRQYPEDRLHIGFGETTDEVVDVKVWDDEVISKAVSEAADLWLSRVLELPVRLVYMDELSTRQIDPDYAEDGEEVSFSDGYPVLIIGQASLDELNSRLQEPIEMRRFRPNLVVTGSAPFAEDDWSEIRIGAIDFKGVKRCARCVMTTINPETGKSGAEPLKTLASYRRVGNKIYFGQNLLIRGLGKVSVGDRIVME